MIKYESIELYGQEDCLYWESVEDFKKFSEEVVVRVEAELSKHKNATLETIALSSGSYSEYGDTYTYESIVLDFERDFTDEEIAEMQQKELEKNLDKDLSIKLVELDVDVNLAYNKFFLEQVKKGIIKVEGLKLW